MLLIKKKKKKDLAFGPCEDFAIFNYTKYASNFQNVGSRHLGNYFDVETSWIQIFCSCFKVFLWLVTGPVGNSCELKAALIYTVFIFPSVMADYSSCPHRMLSNIWPIHSGYWILSQYSSRDNLSLFPAAKPLWLIWEQICEISLSCVLKWGSMGIYALFYRWDVKIGQIDSMFPHKHTHTVCCIYIYTLIFVTFLSLKYIYFSNSMYRRPIPALQDQQIDTTASMYNKVRIQKVSWKWGKAQRSSLKGQLNLIHIHHFLSSN